MIARTSYPGLLRGAALTALCATALLACTPKDKRILFDGHYFKTKAKAVDRKVSVAEFRVEVKNTGQSLEGARAAGAYAGTRYCIENYGSSQIVWARGPEDEPQNLVFDRDSLILQGTCQKP